MRKYLLTFVWLFSQVLCWAQEDRIATIESQLEELSTTVEGLNGPVDFTLTDAPIHELLRAVAEAHTLNINIRSLPNISITNNFNNVQVKDVLVFLCKEYSLSIEFVNNILTVRPYAEVKWVPLSIEYSGDSDHLDFDLQSDTLAAVAKEITRKSGKNVLTTPEVRHQLVSGYVAKLPLANALKQLAVTNNLELEQDESGVFIFRPKELPEPTPETSANTRNNSSSRNRRNQRNTRASGKFTVGTIVEGTETYLTLDARNADVAEVINAAARELKINYAFLEPPQGAIEGYFSKITFEKFLAFATESASVTYGKKSGVYLIGSNERAGLGDANVYRFQKRSVEGMQEAIPTIYQNGLQISTMPELNALLITGGKREAEALLAFLEKIDEPIPNVLIEVIVTELNKGSSISTGIQAFLSDSVPPTGGQLFGGVNLTLGAPSINSVLSNLDSRGIVNLGRVTPRFYATIQALENNNNLKIRSTPKLSTLNGNEASLTIGQSVFFLIETQNVTGGVNPIITTTPRFEQVEANLDIKITPFVSGNNDITLGIEAEFSDFIDPTIQGAPPGNATRQFISKIRVRNEEMIVLGGLEEVTDSETGSGVPFLSRIPILKWLFSSKTKSQQSNRLLIFIKPTIVY